MERKTYRAKREIELQFPDPKYGNHYLTIPAGQTMTGRVVEDFLYMEIQGFGPARIPLVLLEEVK